MEIRPIAYFHSPFRTKFGIPRQAGLAPDLKGQIVFEKEYSSSDAVRGLEGFDYLWIIWGFSESVPDKAPADKTAFRPTVRPPRLGGNERIGVFASRSPFRPNSLGLSSVRIESIGDGVINVLGADLLDGTPIYDIKPYVEYADSHPSVRSGFVDDNEWKPLEVVVPEELAKEGLDLEALRQVLSQDPRPQYKEDSDKEYGMVFQGFDIHFVVNERTATVTSIEKY